MPENHKTTSEEPENNSQKSLSERLNDLKEPADKELEEKIKRLEQEKQNLIIEKSNIQTVITGFYTAGIAGIIIMIVAYCYHRYSNPPNNNHSNTSYPTKNQQDFVIPKEYTGSVTDGKGKRFDVNYTENKNIGYRTVTQIIVKPEGDETTYTLIDIDNRAEVTELEASIEKAELEEVIIDDGKQTIKFSSKFAHPHSLFGQKNQEAFDKFNPLYRELLREIRKKIAEESDTITKNVPNYKK